MILVAVGYLALTTVLSLGTSATVRRRAVIASVSAALLFVGAAAVASGTAVQLLAALLILVTAFSVGTALLALLRVETGFSAWERVALGAGLGLGVLSHLTVVLGIFGALYPAAAFTLLVALLALTHRFLLRSAGWTWRAARSLLMEQAPDHLLLFGILLVFLSLAAVQTMAPPIRWDDLAYHLLVAKRHATSHQLVLLPDVVHSFLYQGVEMLHTLAFLLGGEATVIALNGVHAVLAALALGGFASRVFSRESAWFAAVFWTTTPLIAEWQTSGYVDIGASLFSLLSVIAAYACVRQANWRAGLLAGFFGGFAVSAKLNAALFIVALLCVLTVILGISRGLAGLARLAAPYAAGFAGTGFVWPLLRFVQTGNPVYPFFNAIFRAPGYPPVNEWFDPGIPDVGMGRSIAGFLALPWNLTFHGDRFSDEANPYVLGPYLLLAVILCLLIVPRIRGELGWSICVATIFIGVLFFVGAQDLRFLLPAWPLVILAAAVSLTRVLEPVTRYLRRAAVTLSCGVLCSAMLVIWLASCVPEPVPFRVVFGNESRAAFLARTVPAYLAFRTAGEACESPAPAVLSIGNMFQYLCPHMIRWDSPRASFVNRTGTDTFYRQALGKLDIGFVVVEDGLVAASSTPFVASGFLGRAGELVYSGRSVRLFRIPGSGAHRAGKLAWAQRIPDDSPYRPGLLERFDPAFEPAAGTESHWTPGWVSRPALAVGTDTLGYAEAKEGKGALHVSLPGPSYCREDETASARFPKAAVEVVPGQSYRFSFDLLCSGLIESPLITLRFRGDSGSDAGSVEVAGNITCDTSWRRFQAIVNTPARATRMYPEFGFTCRGVFPYARYVQLDRLGLEPEPR